MKQLLLQVYYDPDQPGWLEWHRSGFERITRGTVFNMIDLMVHEAGFWTDLYRKEVESPGSKQEEDNILRAARKDYARQIGGGAVMPVSHKIQVKEKEIAELNLQIWGLKAVIKDKQTRLGELVAEYDLMIPDKKQKTLDGGCP